MCDESFDWAMTVFTAIDFNGDQMISERELGEAHAMITKRGAFRDHRMAGMLTNGGKMDDIIDTNNDKKVDVDEWLASKMLTKKNSSPRMMN